jgi:hypothetical protein
MEEGKRKMEEVWRREIKIVESLNCWGFRKAKQ